MSIDHIMVLVMMTCASIAAVSFLCAHYWPRFERRAAVYGFSFTVYTVAIAIGFLVNGCGVPPIRTAANVSHDLAVGMDTAGDLVAEQTQRQVDRCSDQACIDAVSVESERIAALLDAGAPAVDAYHDEVLITCGVDPSDSHAVAPDSCAQPPDDVWQRIQRLGVDALRAIPDIVAALRAFGVTVPSELLVGGGS